MNSWRLKKRFGRLIKQRKSIDGQLWSVIVASRILFFVWFLSLFCLVYIILFFRNSKVDGQFIRRNLSAFSLVVSVLCLCWICNVICQLRTIKTSNKFINLSSKFSNIEEFKQLRRKVKSFKLSLAIDLLIFLFFPILRFFSQWCVIASFYELREKHKKLNDFV